jgi:hypothetical protein
VDTGSKFKILLNKASGIAKQSTQRNSTFRLNLTKKEAFSIQKIKLETLPKQILLKRPQRSQNLREIHHQISPQWAAQKSQTTQHLPL